MQSALERGVTSLPGGPPLWLISLRQGVMMLVLGAGLVLAGGGIHHVARGVEMPAVFARAPGLDAPPAPTELAGPRDERPGQGREFDQYRGGLRPPPPRQDPPLERWHRAQ